MTQDGDGPRGDRPLFHAWRGLMLDCARHFWPAPLLMRVLEEVAAGGGNRLHLHLTDDQGWRLPLPGRPALAEPGACYTAAELKALVARGRELGVEILPEVDLPGHCGALLAALPELSCSGAPRARPAAWGCHEALLCLGRPQALDFLDELLAALGEIFPYPVVHLGGDEVPAHVWGRCPRCLELARREGLKGPEGLPGWWLRRAGERLARAGRRGAFWDEALEGPAPADALIFAWRGRQAVRRALEAGHETVACPQRPCYLDHYPGLEEGQALAIGGHNPWRELRAFDPREGCEDLPAEARARLLGGQGNLWTEYVETPQLLMERLQPRLAALLEALWQGPEDAEPTFAERLPGILAAQRARGWMPRVDSPEPEGSIESLRARGSLPQPRRESPRPALPPLPLSAPPVLCRWLAAEGDDWRTVRVPGLPSWRMESLDWPAELVAAQVEQGPPPPGGDVERGAPAGPPLPALAPPPSGWGLRRHFSLHARADGVWTFILWAQDRARLWLDGELLLDQDGFRPGGLLAGEAALAAGRHELRLDWLHLRGGGCRLTCRPPDGMECPIDPWLRPPS